MNNRGSSEPSRLTDIDWQKIYERLENTRTAAEDGLRESPEERRNVLKNRARALARPPEIENVEAYLEVVEFGLAGETYAVESIYVRDVHPLKELTPLPCTPPFVLGIVNLRGQILSVVDLKKFFDLPEKGLSDLDRVIVLRAGEMEFGVLADSIGGARRIRMSELQGSLPTLTDVREEYLKGVTGERTVVLDAGKLLADTDIIVHEEVEG
ncbi:MAG: purine-binding chemotaxis protein CheW [Gemmatimonadetes bacterium]|jgi:purine-binding chemotaxis protein CheW|nr:purine-binding chemotaxis protein CheW [Gemmatimonadota bacterium]